MRHVLSLALAAAAVSMPLVAEESPQAAKAELASLSKQLGLLSRCFNLVHEVVAPSVVSIKTSEDIANPFTARNEAVDVGEGSGFVVHADGKASYILTNAHVVLQTNDNQEFVRGRNEQFLGYDHLVVELNDNRDIDAEYVGVDASTDLAVIKVGVPNLPAIDWADSDHVTVGDWVLALGYPLGVGYSATSGIVSATDRSTGIYHAIRGLESFIQTDAPINPGNSGGPLVGLDGHIIGVNSNILSRTGVNIGIGFAIPANLARRVADDLIRFGRVHWAGIGVDLEEIPVTQAEGLGLTNGQQAVCITNVLPHTPAAEAGIHPGDIVLAVNAVKIRSKMSFRARFACCQIGVPVALGLWRDHAEVSVQVTPIDRDILLRAHANDQELQLHAFGLTVAVDAGAGLLVTAVAAGSPAAAAHLAIGDRLLRDEQSLHELRTLEDAEALSVRREAVLLVLHDGRPFRRRLVAPERR